MRVRTGMQPDSLKLTSQLAILKVVHRTAFKLDETQGDKSSGKTFYLRGIQGQVDPRRPGGGLGTEKQGVSTGAQGPQKSQVL